MAARESLIGGAAPNCVSNNSLQVRDLQARRETGRHGGECLSVFEDGCSLTLLKDRASSCLVHLLSLVAIEECTTCSLDFAGLYRTARRSNTPSSPGGTI